MTEEQLEEVKNAWRRYHNAQSNIKRMSKYRHLSDGMRSDLNRHYQDELAALQVLNTHLGMT